MIPFTVTLGVEQLLIGNFKGEFAAGIDLPASLALQKMETNLDGSDKIAFMHFMDKMLRWAPEDRKTARELLDDPWLKEQID